MAANNPYEKVKIIRDKLKEYGEREGYGEIDVPHYNWDEIDFSNASTCIIGGNTRSGKTKLMTALITHLVRDYDNINIGAFYLCSPTYMFQEDLKNFIPIEMVVNPKEVDIDTFLGNLIDIQTNIAYEERQTVVVIIDDVSGVVQKSQRLKELFTSGRHYNIMCFLLLQHLSGLSDPTIRSNCNYFLTSKFTSSSREIVIDNIKDLIGNRKLASQLVASTSSVRYLFLGMTNLPNQSELFTISIDDVDDFKPIRIEFDSSDEDILDVEDIIKGDEGQKEWF